MEPIQLQVETFERFMLDGQSPGFPMSFSINFELTKGLDQARLKRALENSLAKHPILSTTLDPTHKRWLVNSHSPSINRLENIDLPVIDLNHENGLKVSLSEPSSAKQEIRFGFHHACVDGLGAFQFILDVAASYAGKTSSTNEISNSIDYLKRFRRSYGGNRLMNLLRWPIDLMGMAWAFEMIWNRPNTIESPSSDTEMPMTAAENSPSPTPKREVLRIVFDETQSKQIKRQAKQEGQTINDRLLVTVFQAIEAWYAKHDPKKSGELIRIMVPINLRRHATPSAANMVAMVNLDRKVGKWKSAKRFAKILRLEMGCIKKFRVGVTANRFLQVQRGILGRWPMQENHDQCLATTVVSNVGDLSRLATNDPTGRIQFDDSKVSGIEIVAPLRPQTHFFVCAYTYENCLNLNVNYDPRRLSCSHAKSLTHDIRDKMLGG